MNDEEVPRPGADHVFLTVKWQPHPMDQHGKAYESQYKMDRVSLQAQQLERAYHADIVLFPIFHPQSENFRELFEATADDANVMAENLIMTYRDKRFFPSVTPHTLKIWTEAAELGIYILLNTHFKPEFILILDN